jgi:hypothetical protein
MRVEAVYLECTKSRGVWRALGTPWRGDRDRDRDSRCHLTTPTLELNFNFKLKISDLLVVRRVILRSRLKKKYIPADRAYFSLLFIFVFVSLTRRSVSRGVSDIGWGHLSLDAWKRTWAWACVYRHSNWKFGHIPNSTRPDSLSTFMTERKTKRNAGRALSSRKRYFSPGLPVFPAYTEDSKMYLCSDPYYGQ